MEKWKREGTLEARRELARKLIAEGFPVEKIAQMVELNRVRLDWDHRNRTAWLAISAGRRWNRVNVRRNAASRSFVV